MTSIIKHLFIDRSSGFQTLSLFHKKYPILIHTPEIWTEKPFKKLRTRADFQQKGFFLDTDIYKTYSELKCLFENSDRQLLSGFLSELKLSNCIVHFDPEFRFWTFGITHEDSLRFAILNHLDEIEQGIPFSIYMVASMRSFTKRKISDEWAKFIIGLFEVSEIKYEYVEGMPEVLDYSCINQINLNYPINEKRLSNNFHFNARLSGEYDAESMFILLGDQKKSKLFCPPIRISSWNNEVNDLKNVFSKNYRKFRGFQYLNPKDEEIVRNISSNSNYHNHPDFLF